MKNAALNIVSTNKNLKSMARAGRKQTKLLDLVKIFAGHERPTHANITMLKEQFYTLILVTNSVERKEISKALAQNFYTPRAIVMFLAMAEIGVAMPLLLKSPVLKSEDLNMILDKTELAHAKVISRREGLELNTVKELMKRNDETDIIKTTLLSNSTILDNKEMLAFVKQPKPETWQEIPAENITTFQMPEAIPVSSTTKSLSNSLIELASKGGKLKRAPRGKALSSQNKTSTRKQVETQLLNAARSMNINTFAFTVQNLCGLKREITFEFITKQDAGMLASLLNALEISEISAARIMLLLNRNIGRNNQIFKLVMHKYSKLDHDQCLELFSKLGASFKKHEALEPEDYKNTRFALSLAARDRRAQLLKNKQVQKENIEQTKARA